MLVFMKVWNIICNYCLCENFSLELISENQRERKDLVQNLLKIKSGWGYLTYLQLVFNVWWSRMNVRNTEILVVNKRMHVFTCLQTPDRVDLVKTEMNRKKQGAQSSNRWAFLPWNRVKGKQNYLWQFSNFILWVIWLGGSAGQILLSLFIWSFLCRRYHACCIPGWQDPVQSSGIAMIGSYLDTIWVGF